MADETGTGYWRGLVTGLLFGAAAAMLLAPKKGDELRHDLAEGAVKLKDQAAGLSDTAVQSLSSAAGVVAEKAHEIQAQGAEIISRTQSTLSGSSANDSGASDALAGTLRDAETVADEAGTGT